MAGELLFKNILSTHLIDIMGRNIQNASNNFDKSLFVKKAKNGLNKLELKDRAKHIARSIHAAFNEDYRVGAEAIILSMETPLTEADDLGKYPGFYFMPFSEFIILFGLNHYETSIRANYALTKVYSAEFSIRPFLLHRTKDTLNKLEDWTNDENHHVRRLVSEGTRTRLPWAGRLPHFQKDPSAVISLLEKLKNDPELYVRRSVANNLNDIAKDHPQRVIETLSKWQTSTDRNANTDWIIKHASRTLIKEGHTEALKLQGFDPEAQIELHDFTASERVKFGDKLELSFTLKNTDKKNQKLVVDFVVYFKKANGKLAPKVFKLKELNLKAGALLKMSKTHSIKPITTRKYYNGNQEVAVQVNGRELGRRVFLLEGL